MQSALNLLTQHIDKSYVSNMISADLQAKIVDFVQNTNNCSTKLFIDDAAVAYKLANSACQHHRWTCEHTFEALPNNCACCNLPCNGEYCKCCNEVNKTDDTYQEYIEVLINTLTDIGVSIGKTVNKIIKTSVNKTVKTTAKRTVADSKIKQTTKAVSTPVDDRSTLSDVLNQITPATMKES